MQTHTNAAIATADTSQLIDPWALRWARLLISARGRTERQGDCRSERGIDNAVLNVQGWWGRVDRDRKGRPHFTDESATRRANTHKRRNLFGDAHVFALAPAWSGAPPGQPRMKTFGIQSRDNKSPTPEGHLDGGNIWEQRESGEDERQKQRGRWPRLCLHVYASSLLLFIPPPFRGEKLLIWFAKATTQCDEMVAQRSRGHGQVPIIFHRADLVLNWILTGVRK